MKEISVELLLEAKKYKTIERFVQKTHDKFYRMSGIDRLNNKKIIEEFYSGKLEYIWNKSQFMK
jgi:hypothetical protein